MCLITYLLTAVYNLRKSGVKSNYKGVYIHDAVFPAVWNVYNQRVLMSY